jgi:hypothetical protein
MLCAGKTYCCGGAEESKGSGGDAAATVAHAMKGGDGEEDKDAGADAALPHALAPMGAPSVHCCGGERIVHCFGGAEESKGGGGEEERTATRLLSYRTRWRPWERQARRRRGITENRRFRKDQVTRRYSVARLATFDNWHLAAGKGPQLAFSVTTDVVS